MQTTSLAAGPRECPAPCRKQAAQRQTACVTKQNEQALLVRKPSQLARPQEEPTYLIQLTSIGGKSSSLFRRRGRAVHAACGLRGQAIPGPARNVDSAAPRREKPPCDSSAGR